MEPITSRPLVPAAVGKAAKHAGPLRAPPPEQTTLYRLVQQHAQRFFDQTEETTGSGLPQFVRNDFDAFHERGILAHGVLRLRCGDCGHDKLLGKSVAANRPWRRGRRWRPAAGRHRLVFLTLGCQ
ncbi:MAG: hypothetical protein ACKVP1_12155 [Burkholderiaceae bacterium]